jgi:Ulp1 family protease
MQTQVDLSSEKENVVDDAHSIEIDLTSLEDEPLYSHTENEVFIKRQIAYDVAEINSSFHHEHVIEQFRRDHGIAQLDDRRDQYENQLPRVWMKERKVFFAPDQIEHGQVSAILNEYKRNVNDDEILLEISCIPITRETFQRLRPEMWLNDEIINIYMCLLDKRDSKLCMLYPEQRKRSLFFNTFSIQLTKIGIEQANKYCSKGKINIFNFKRLYFPINIKNIHWTLIVIDMENKSIVYYDSFHGDGSRLFTLAQQFLEQEAERQQEELKFEEWQTINAKDNPVQQDGTECGVHVLIITDHMSDNLPLDYSAEDTSNWRMKIAHAILQKSLDTTYSVVM